ncbi:exodeoxyribonuclease VII small subunit [Chamaesiphon sp. GL140_3_metabinner_50]|uniref:exodeoxyribonuclease VII small subunit n=1 Tax=Chamaesiphon sp. GL140_3_metabinner_50 TaxID=2970812 RepID=UPI0025D689D4|nr:exodeoxyribonuclease VII small subunit [Chamaesiphon sp. GL140_3_metabinner_50]
MAKKNNWKYEETVDRIEEILAQIEGGDLELAEVFSQFEIAIASLQQCENFLAEHRERVELLLENLGNS